MLWWHHWLNGHEFEQIQGDSEGQGSLHAAVHGFAKSQTQLINWTTRTSKQRDYLISSVTYATLWFRYFLIGAIVKRYFFAYSKDEIISRKIRRMAWNKENMLFGVTVEVLRMVSRVYPMMSQPKFSFRISCFLSPKFLWRLSPDSWKLTISLEIIYD